MKTTLALIALAGALCVAPAAAQSSSHDDRTRIVDTADLDLRSDHGRAVLDRRIRAAVHAACGIPSSADALGKAKLRQCRTETMARAAVQRDRAVAAAFGPSPAILASQR